MVKIALEVWGPEFEVVLSTCQRAERLGIDAFYYGESPHGLNLECWTTLAALARSTGRIRLGPVIANILPGYRSTALLANQAATVARISGGRLDLRTGVGASARHGSAWWGPYGVDYPGYDQRLAQLTAALDELSAQWAAMGPGLPPIPLTIAASGPRAMALAAARAHLWETSFCLPAEVEARIEAMAALAGGRVVPCSLEIDGFTATTEGGLDRLLARVRDERGGHEDLDPVLARALIGLPSQVAGQLAVLAAAGVDQVVVALHDPHDPDALDALAAARLDPSS